jgi:signal transduction histidine kinase
MRIIGLFIVSSIMYACVLVVIGLVALITKVSFAFNFSNLLLFFLSVFITVSTSSYFYSLVRTFLSKYLPSSPFNVAFELENLSKRLISVLELNELTNIVVNTVFDILQVKNISLLILNSDSKTYLCATAAGFNISDMTRLSVSSDDMLITALSKIKNVTYRDLLIKSLSWQDASLVSHTFAKLRSLYIFPIMHNDSIEALLCLNSKKSQKKFTRREIFSLQNLCKNLAPALHNAATMNLLKKINNDLVDAQSQLLQTAKMSALEKLAAGIAHEIHNPLTIISGKAQVLLLKGEKKFEKEKVQEVLSTIVQQTKRAADITRRLLMFAKPQQIETKRLINVESVISDTISLVSYQVSLDEIRIVKIIESNIPFVAGSLIELRELFLNLILNAIQAIGNKGVITISVKHLENDGVVKISVADTGKGIPSEDINTIFDPFYTTKTDCVGLGLFVCQQIVNRMRGSIKVESIPNSGSIFNILLPIPLRITTLQGSKTIVRHDEATVDNLNHVQL